MSERKTALTPHEKIIAAFMYYVREVDQQDIAIMLGGVNGGRISDACRDIGILVGLRPGVNALKTERSPYPTVLPVINNEA